MKTIIIRQPSKCDENDFIASMVKSKALHYPWVSAPIDQKTFSAYLEKYSLPNNISFLVIERKAIAGVINLNEIIHGSFKNAYLGYYAVDGFCGRGLMRQGMIQVIQYAYKIIGLHRLEANIQPDNIQSINFINSLNFVKEGYSSKYLFLDGKWRDHERWALLLEDSYMNMI